MPRLKAFQAAMGFYETVVAAPSKKAALEAWGARQDLFQEGLARLADDPAAVEAALARPGVVLRRAAGSSQPFQEEAPPPTLPRTPAKAKSTARPQPPEPEPPPPDRSELAAAERALAQAERERDRAMASIARERQALEAKEREAQDAFQAQRRPLERAIEKARKAYRRAGGED